jgi:Co/Zn/Cd efflux system component
MSVSIGSGGSTGTAAAAHRRRLVAVLVLSIVILLVEVGGAIVSNSLALFADAGHMLTDISGIGLSRLALRAAGGRLGTSDSRSLPPSPTRSCCSGLRHSS